mmetsp:Transcript_32524/g.82892  ORF Transcript_32524/g.82892 Transcript_32524/m.82892 type:complete len:100 (+) Transcript_32524:330-629(+)
MFVKAREAAARRAEAELHAFLASEGFGLDVNSLRRKFFRKTFPLHVACKRGDDRMVGLLVTSGADATSRDWRRRTPADVAKRYNRSGSHDAVLRALGCH